MAAIARSGTPFVACVNVDVLPSPDWAESLLSHLGTREDVGATFARLEPAEPARLLSRWRMRFHEEKFDRPNGSATFAPGHAVLFRRSALDRVGGYDPRLRRVREDSDICERLWAVGIATHYVNGPRCTSIQTDDLQYLAGKQLVRDGFDPGRPLDATGVRWRAARALVNRLGRNALRGRWPFLPVDIAVFALELFHYHRARRSALRNASSIDPSIPQSLHGHAGGDGTKGAV
jgi:hypothetical protein